MEGKFTMPVPLEDAVVPLLQQLIRNRCVNEGTVESGREIQSALTLKDFFSLYGIDVEIIESAPGRANLVARRYGVKSGAPALAYLSHLDVVPANDKEWSVDPFGGDVRNGYVWGRGALDMLSTTATQAVAFASIFHSGAIFPGDLVFIAAADEEASGRYGVQWLVENHWEKIRADYCITELGGFFTEGCGVTVDVGEKGIVWLKLNATGAAGHGSLPWGAKNAALLIARAVTRLSDHLPRIDFSSEYRRMVMTSPLPAGLKTRLLKKNQCDRALDELRRRDEGAARFLHAASRMTISPNIMTAGSKINIVPDKGTAELDIRIPPGMTVDDVIVEIRTALGELARYIEIEIVDYFPSTSSPVDTPLYAATKEIVGGVYPYARLIPYLSGGVTDGRFFRKRGTVTYGFMLADEKLTITEYASLVHGKDERVSVKTLQLSCRYFYHLPEVFFGSPHDCDESKK